RGRHAGADRGRRVGAVGAAVDSADAWGGRNRYHRRMEAAGGPGGRRRDAVRLQRPSSGGRGGGGTRGALATLAVGLEREAIPSGRGVAEGSGGPASPSSHLASLAGPFSGPCP